MTLAKPRRASRVQRSRSRDKFMERVRANHTLVEAVTGRMSAEKAEDFELEAFMALFHPEFQKDRRKMAQLKWRS